MALNLSFCKVARTIADLYKDLFQEGGANYNGLISFITMPLLGISSLSELVRTVPGSMSVSSLSDMIKNFHGNRFMKRMRSSILKRYKGELNPDDFCFAIDDTDNKKYQRFPDFNNILSS